VSSILSAQMGSNCCRKVTLLSLSSACALLRPEFRACQTSAEHMRSRLVCKQGRHHGAQRYTPFGLDCRLCFVYLASALSQVASHPRPAPVSLALPAGV